MPNTTRIASYGEIREALDDLPDAVRAVRRIRGISQIEAAAEMGISRHGVSRFEAGEDYNVKTLYAVLHWLDNQRPGEAA